MEKFVQNKNMCATLLQLKLLHRISYKKMGDIIGYADTGMAKALKNNTLSLDQVELIIKTLNLDINDVDVITDTSVKMTEKIQETSLFIIQNKEAMMEDALFKLFIDSTVNEIVIEKLKKL